MGEENMGARLPRKLLSLLIILKVFGSTEASCRGQLPTRVDFNNLKLTSVPLNWLPCITYLDLQNNEITTLHQSDFSGYVNLTMLDLHNNHITTISTRAFYNLSNLTYLYLSRNSLSNLRSDMFTGLGNLQYLSLHSNEISNIQKGTFSSTPRLITLWLYQNKLATIRSDMFTGLGNLQNLILYNNEISDIQTGTYNSTPQLRNLYLHYNNLTTLRSDMFTGLGNLQGFYLYNNDISDIQAGTFNSTPQLRTLRLDQNKLTTLRSVMFTGLGNLETLNLDNNEISDIQAGTFISTPQLRYLYLYQNKLTTLRSDTFTGLGNLQHLFLHNNEISDIQAGTFNSISHLRDLFLQYNRLTVLKAEIFTKLSSFFVVYIDNNPWQCDCRMVPFRQKMTRSHSFENQITCSGPSNFHGQKLIDISPEDLICEEPTIGRFERIQNYTVVRGETLHLVCEASGIPKPDITVILPSGHNATVESGGRVTVGVNGAITITNVTAAEAGLYACVAASPVGSSSATLVVNVQLKATTTVTTTGTVTPYSVTSPVNMNKTENGARYNNEFESVSAFSVPVPILIGSVCGSVAGTALIGAIFFAIWHKRKKQKPSSDQTPPVVFSNASANVTISEHDQTGDGGVQTRSSEHVPGRATSEVLEYEDVVLPPRNVNNNTSPNSAGLIQQPHEYQSLGPNRNRAPRDELPPLPPPSNRNNGGPTGTHDTQHYYQSLKKKT